MSKSRTGNELVGYEAALTKIHTSANHIEFRLDVIIRLHGILCSLSRGEGGRWKPKDNVVLYPFSGWACIYPLLLALVGWLLSSRV